MSKHSSEDELDQHIIETVKQNKPETVSQLVNLINQKHRLPERKILDQVMLLQEKGKIRLKSPQIKTPQSLTAYVSSSQAAWYWITITLTTATVLIIFTVPEEAYLLAYVRNILGAIFILWLPGYAFIRALFPKKLAVKTSDKDMDTIERIALSIGMSLTLVPIVGLLLNYTPWGIKLTPITLSLTALTLAFATAALMREYQTTKTPPV